MMTESSDDVAAEIGAVESEAREGEGNDNGALRSSGFVLVSDAGSEVSSLRPGGPPPPAPPSSGTTGTSGSRELSMSPPSNPYRGALPHLQHGYSLSHEAAGGFYSGHGHSHDGGHGHSHDVAPEPAPLPAAFFTPSAPAPDAPLPNLSPPPPPPTAAAPPSGFPFPQYQLPQFQRPSSTAAEQQPPPPPQFGVQPAPLPGDPSGAHHVGLNLGDAEPAACGEHHGHSHGHGGGDHGHSHGGGGGGGGGGGFLSSLFGSELVHKVVEKTKSGMETVITTLDPGMKEYILGGGDVNLVIACGDEAVALAVRDAFYTVFGKATVRIMPPQAPEAALIFGAEAARNACLQQMTAARSSGLVPPDAAFLSIAGFLSEPTPGRFFVTEYLLLQDPTSTAGVDGSAPLECDAYSVALSVPSGIVSEARSTGQSFEAVMARNQQQQQQQQQNYQQPQGAPAVASDWRQMRYGLSRRDLVGQAARLLARDYRGSGRGRFDPMGPVLHS